MRRSRWFASSERPTGCWSRGRSCPSRQGAGGVGGDVSPLARAIWRDEGRRCEAAEGARGRERPVEADRGRSNVGGRVARGERGKLVSPLRRRQAVWML